jgi:hypothetical protein
MVDEMLGLARRADAAGHADVAHDSEDIGNGLARTADWAVALM